MIPVFEYIISKSTKRYTIKATDENINQVIKDELDRLGHDASLNHIDVSGVTDISSAFSITSRFLSEEYKDVNPDISQWDVSNVENMRRMFNGCEKFNCNISKWDVSKVSDMRRMFYECKNFNQDISNWNVSNVKDIYQIFINCTLKEIYKPTFNLK